MPYLSCAYYHPLSSTSPNHSDSDVSHIYIFQVESVGPLQFQLLANYKSIQAENFHQHRGKMFPECLTQLTWSNGACSSSIVVQSL